jgi:hypothetical protein
MLKGVNKMSGSKIKCAVENCAYNEDYQCNASGIEVNAMGDSLALSADGTSCQTFMKKK